ncbi:head GIN domain-containing protein [uncultured Draconibacterium sp.]|uniref:head GIN domain-containing protein n=1 Tax=uncultured Draconibacterium sp. TaxID=1573823 RepID=UPI003217A362
MKTLKSLFILTLAVFMGISTAIAGNSDETQIRKVENFNAIKVSTGIDLYLTMGTSEEVKIVADDDIIDDLKTEVKDGTLHIYVKQNNWFNWGGNKTRKAYVTVTELVALHASSGSDVRSENTIKGTSLEVKASSGSDVVLDVFYKNLSVDTSSGSDAKISGRVKTLEAESSSGSDIKAEGLEAQIGKLKASSGSDITVTVTDELYARASSGSDIKYYGNPQIRDTDESSGGDVRHK